MYQVSEAYLTQMMKKGTRRRLLGTVGTVPFTSNDVKAGSFYVSGRANEESDTKIGNVFIGELELTFVPSFVNKVAVNQYRNSVISVNIGLLVDPENDEWVNVPVGVYTLQAPKISKEGIAVTGYDNMSKLDKKFNIDVTSATPWGYLSFIADNCNVTIGNTEQEIQSFENGSELLPLYTPNDIETYRDLLFWVAQACGCFACADRFGNIVLRKFGTETGIEFDQLHRDNDVEFSGYTTKWTGISIVDMETQTTRYYGLEVDDGLTMNLGSNPLLQLGSATAVERRRRAVLNAVSRIQYTPFYMNSARDPIFDLGDEIPFTGGLSGNCTGCVMFYEYSLNNFNFEGYGDDPALANARSKTDKNISGLMQNTVENEVTYYNYTNAEPITITPDNEIEIASLAFMSAQETTVKILHEFMFDIVQDLAVGGAYEVHYYLDDELLAYKPYEALGAISQRTGGDNTSLSVTRDFFYILKNVEPNTRHVWQVKILAHDVNSMTIQREHAHITIEGQRLYGEEYAGGFIEAKDYITIIPLGSLQLVSITDSVAITPSSKWWHDETKASDNIGMYNINNIGVMQINDAEPVILKKRGFYWRLENGKIWALENDNRWFTE